MTTDIDKLAQQMREAATGVEAALPHGTWDSVRAYHRAQDRFRNVADTESVLALLDDRERLKAALANEESYLLRLLADDNLMRGDIEGTFHRLRTGDFEGDFVTTGGGNG